MWGRDGSLRGATVGGGHSASSQSICTDIVDSQVLSRAQVPSATQMRHDSQSFESGTEAFQLQAFEGKESYKTHRCQGPTLPVLH